LGAPSPAARLFTPRRLPLPPHTDGDDSEKILLSTSPARGKRPGVLEDAAVPGERYRDKHSAYYQKYGLK